MILNCQDFCLKKWWFIISRLRLIYTHKRIQLWTIFTVIFTDSFLRKHFVLDFAGICIQRWTPLAGILQVSCRYFAKSARYWLFFYRYWTSQKPVKKQKKKLQVIFREFQVMAFFYRYWIFKIESETCKKAKKILQVLFKYLQKLMKIKNFFRVQVVPIQHATPPYGEVILEIDWWFKRWPYS